MEESFNYLKKENKILNEKLKENGNRLDINIFKIEIKNLKELSKQTQTENSRKEKELNDLIIELKKKIYDYEEIFKNLQPNKKGSFTKNNFYYSVNNVNNGNLVLNNLNTNNSISGNVKISENGNDNNNTSNREKFEMFVSNE
jgi:hypothetical protein